MTSSEIIDKLYRKHTVWVLMVENRLPIYAPITAEDIVQDMYLKIYQKLKEKKIKKTLIIKGEQVQYNYIYVTLINLTNDVFRTEQETLPLKEELINKEQEEQTEFFEKIDSIIDNFYWYYEKLFKLYTIKFKGNMSKLSKETKISYKTIWKDINQIKKLIKKQYENGK
jgi:DNA-directed RNA polymerase specialized sigma24 family protein